MLRKIYKWLFVPKPDQSTTIGEVNSQINVTDCIYPIQRFMNGIHDLTERSGWDVNDWTLQDMNDFMACVNDIGGQNNENN